MVYQKITCRMDVSIVIVNYKTPQLLLDCVKSVYEYTNYCTFEVIVVDNDSKDFSKSLLLSNFPNVKWIDMGYNAGFGRANNKGIDLAKGDYTLLLNSDVELYEDAISNTLTYYKFLEKDSRVGLVGCQVKHKDGRLQPSCNYYWAGIREVIEEHPIGIKISQHWLKLKKLRDTNKYDRLNTNHKITWLGVPFALISSKLLKKDKFDEEFFMYSEDEELNYRLSKKGYKPYFFSETGVYHHIGASSKSSIKRDIQIFYSKLQFIKKTKGIIYFWIYCKLLRSSFKWNQKMAKRTKNISTIQYYEINDMKKYIDSRGMLNVYENF